MATYKVDIAASTVEVMARSSVHDTKTVWPTITGTIEADQGALEGEQAKATIEVEMSDFDAGSWLKNRHLKKEFDLGKKSKATFILQRLGEVNVDGEQISASGVGVLSWRGKNVELQIAGSGTMTGDEIAVQCKFEFNITDIGLKAPSFLMFKVEDDVEVSVTLRARTA